MAEISKTPLGIRMCELAGLDPNEIRKVTLVSEVAERDHLIVEMYPKGSLDPLIEEFFLVKEGYGIPESSEVREANG